MVKQQTVRLQFLYSPSLYIGSFSLGTSNHTRMISTLEPGSLPRAIPPLTKAHDGSGPNMDQDTSDFTALLAETH